MPLLSCCRSAGLSKLDQDDNHCYTTAPSANPRRTARPKSNVVASSESLGPPKSTRFSTYDDTKSNQEEGKSPRRNVAFTFNAGSTESTVVTSSDLYNKTDNPATVEQWMAIFQEAKNQSQQANGNQSQSVVQSTAASSTYIGSDDRMTMDESGTSIDIDDDNSQSSSRRLPAMQSLGVLPTRPVTLSRPPSHTGTNELEKSHSVAYLTDNAAAERVNMQSTPQLLRSPEVEDVRKEQRQRRLKCTVQRSPEFEDLSRIETDSE